jgi:peptidoglycan/xylan/chitin deacetylase (PgdA/CDA1 family)
MEISPTNDEGEPRRMIKHFFYFLFPVIILLLSCNEKKKEHTVQKPVVDTLAVRLKEKHVADSSAKKTVHRKKIYLTFDDGPNKGTLNVLNAVKEDNVPASFFIVGTHTDDSPQQKAAWEELKTDSTIELCNHSYSHAFNRYTKYYENPAGVIKDIEHNSEALGFDSKIVRMPGRNAWRIDSVNHTDIKESKAAIDSVHAAGFDVMGWDVEWVFDHKTLQPDTSTGLLLRRIENMLDAGKTKTKDHLVLLAHDQEFQTTAAVEQLHYLFRELKNNPDYELELVNNYPGLKKEKLDLLKTPVSDTVVAK